MNIISGSCLLQDGYSFKYENNGCSIYMNNIFYGHAPVVNGLFLLNLKSNETHIHNIEAKRCKVVMALPSRSYWCKTHEETPF
jgi:hypothetical protein